MSTHATNSIFRHLKKHLATACNLITVKAELEAAYLGLSLTFDGIVFAAVLFYTFRASRSSNQKHLLDTLRRDSVIYFFVLFSSQFIWVLCVRYGRVSVPVHRFS